MPSKSKSNSRTKRENPRGKAGTPAKPVARVRAPKSREAAIAQAANLLGRPTPESPSFGAPVSESQVVLYERALKALRKSKTVAQFLGFRSTEQALRALRPVAKGTTNSTSLPAPCRDAFRKLGQKLDQLHNAEGKVNKTWPRKHALVIAALLAEKPARKPAPKKAATPKAVETPAPASTEVPATA